MQKFIGSTRRSIIKAMSQNLTNYEETENLIDNFPPPRDFERIVFETESGDVIKIPLNPLLFENQVEIREAVLNGYKNLLKHFNGLIDKQIEDLKVNK